MKKSTAALIGVSSFAAGIILGFLISPVKHGFGNNNGNKSYHYYGDNWTHNLDDDTSCDFDSDCECEDDAECLSDMEEVAGDVAEEVVEEIDEIV
ncbi:MAG: hypothetical protein GX257_06405 [Clostridiales bacterium]|jgi:hypothetical protein|nr:hypothetical protein [Clostridiales bacterium]